jgi:hypothetical protein
MAGALITLSFAIVALIGAMAAFLLAQQIFK